MKSQAIIFLLPLIFCSLVSFSQEKIIKPNLEEGQTYVFELANRISNFDGKNNSSVHSVEKITFKFEIEEVTSDKVIFSSIILSGKSEEPNARIKTVFNTEFPPVFKNINLNNNSVNIVKSLLAMVRLQYEINLATNSIKQINTAEMLEEMHSVMTKKGYDKEIISDVIDFVIERNEVRQRIFSYNELLLFFNHSVQEQNETIESPFLEKVFKRTSDGNYVSGQKEKTPGTEFISAKLDKNRGLILDFYKSRYDSAKTTWRTNQYKILTETEIAFLDEYKTGNNYFTFNCTVQNPIDSFVTLFYMDLPYGEENTAKILKLDENNHVSYRINLPERSFVFFSPKELDYRSRIAENIYYAEPGDTLDLEITNKGDKTFIGISGSNQQINTLLNDIRKEKNLFSPSMKTIQINNISTGFQGYSLADKTVIIFDNYLNEKNIKLDAADYNFVKNELLATTYFTYFSYANVVDFIHADPNWINLAGSDLLNENELEAKKAIEMIGDFDIHDVYNDFGFYSRQLSNIYLHYYLRHLPRVVNSGVDYRKTASMEFDKSKLILGGAVYYRTLAGEIIRSINGGYLAYLSATKYELNESLDGIDQLANQSYDEYFIRSLKEFRNKRLNWESEHFVPDVELYKPNGKKTTLEKEIEGKPTIVYVSSDWSRYRYELDKKAAENPDIRFVLIVQGNKLNEWQDYLKKAEPVAEQLILIDNEKTLNDIFLRSSLLYIAFDKNGNLLKYDVELKKAIQLAKQNLAEKKELNKSQLQIIVLVLSLLLISLITALFIWKWQVRQRFRKEEQQRRLRELELTAIRSQMNPHFLFNSLNSVQNLVQQNKGREAHLYLADFAGLIRKVLQNSEKEEVSLAEELEMTQQYLNLEKLRFDFDYQVNVSKEIDMHNTLVPSMLLQPFVENAIIHGLQNKTGNRQLKINISDEGTGIKITIEDNGIGREAAREISKTKNGKGSKLMKERLEILQKRQGEKYQLETVDLNGGKSGTRVEILIPEEK